MDYSYDSHSYKPSRSKHDSFLSPSSRDVYGYSRHSRSSTRLDVPTGEPTSRNKSVNERERRPYHPEPEYRSRSSVRCEETYPSFSTRAKSARRRRSWPPAPSVEDEDDALEKEFPRRRNPKTSDDEVSMPGTVDQNPVLIELENRERRFVVVPGSEDKATKPDPRSSRRRPERPTPLKVETEEPDLFARRQPTPYAFSKSSQPVSNTENAFSRQPQSYSSHQSSSNSSASPSDDESRRRARRTQMGIQSLDEKYMTDDSDLEPAAVSRLRERQTKPRVSFTEPTLSPRPRPEIKRFSSDYTSPTDNRPSASTQEPSLLKGILKQPTSAPSSDDEGSSRRRQKSSNSAPRTIPVPVALPSHIRSENGYGNRPSLDELRDVDRSKTSRSTYPPIGSSQPKERYAPNSSSSSSNRSSRPSSPSLAEFDRRDFANQPPRSNGHGVSKPGANPAYEGQAPYPPPRKPHSRTASWDSTGSRGNDVPPPPPAVLPYPVDDPMILMPNHEHYIDTPTRESFPPQPRMPDYGAKDFTSSPMSSPNLSKDDKFPSRPPPKSNTGVKRPEATNGNAPNATISLPACPRMDYSRGYQDWYTLRGDSSVDVCPSCFEGIVRPTPFRLEFMRAPPRSSTVNTRCDFGSPWYRAAWLLTHKRQRPDIDIIYALSLISSMDSSCPGSREGPGPWYGLLNKDNKFIPGFAICFRDLKYIEAIFPTLVGLFHRMPPSTSERDVKMCSMRLPGERFGDYLNLLEKIDEEARSQPLNSSDSLQQLIKFARASSDRQAPPPPPPPPRTSQSTSTSTCTKDSLLLDATWHFMPLLPDFTVCEECFDEVVWPSIKDKSDLARQFHQVLTPLPAGVRMDGASCQLYSARMRRLWARAVKEGEKEGMKLLARKVRERREIEDELRQEQKEIQRKLERNKKNVGPLADDIRASCKRKLDGVAREWAEWE